MTPRKETYVPNHLNNMQRQTTHLHVKTQNLYGSCQARSTNISSKGLTDWKQCCAVMSQNYTFLNPSFKGPSIPQLYRKKRMQGHSPVPKPREPSKAEDSSCEYFTTSHVKRNTTSISQFKETFNTLKYMIHSKFNLHTQNQSTNGSWAKIRSRQTTFNLLSLVQSKYTKEKPQAHPQLLLSITAALSLRHVLVWTGKSTHNVTTPETPHTDNLILGVPINYLTSPPWSDCPKEDQV